MDSNLIKVMTNKRFFLVNMSNSINKLGSDLINFIDIIFGI